MCGIISGITKNNIIPNIIRGLKHLEYRGYDSSGIAMIIEGKILSVKEVGKVSSLEEKLDEKLYSNIAIAHTRWATHGKPTIENAHPHYTKNVAIVHNGVIENYIDLKIDLESKGYKFNSDTDSEVVAKLLDYHFLQYNDPIKASNKTTNMLKGTYSLAFLFKNKNNFLFVAKNKNPLIIGLDKNDNGIYAASDLMAFDNMVEDVIFLEDGCRAIITDKSCEIFDQDQNSVEAVISKSIKTIKPEKGNYPYFMLKEIHEQPILFKQLLNDYMYGSRFKQISIDWQKLDQIKILACGSAYISGLVAKYWIEELSNIDVSVEVASEYRYRKTANSLNSVTIIISQSGETLDTFEAMKLAQKNGNKIIAIVNVEHSLIARSADYVLPILAGTEVGVASSKAFLNQLGVLSLLALHIGLENGEITDDQKNHYYSMLNQVPDKITKILNNSDKLLDIAQEMKSYNNALFIARHSLAPIAFEGALKLKELSYIHAEAYPAGELKHGPISLIDENMPLIALIPSCNLFEKIFSNLQEAVARNAKTLCIVDEKSLDKIKKYAKWTFQMPEANEFILPILSTVPLQLLAYHVANEKGNDIDQPRNLAKSVTVE